MKKIFLIFLMGCFVNMSAGYCEYFYADALEKTILQEFPENADAVMDAYLANMDSDTGDIDENGFYNVCYAGGYDVATENGAEQCANFLAELQDSKPKYSAPKYAKSQCPNSGVPALTRGCAYASTSDLNAYNNPATYEQKLQKCILNKTIDWAIDNYEGGYQSTAGDTGSTVCKDGQPIYTDGTVGNWKHLDPNKTIKLGATKFGVSTCYTGLSIDCICGMNRLHAKHFYWKIARKYGYFKFPIEIVAPIIQFSISGPGSVSNDMKKVFEKNCGATIGDCHLSALRSKYYTSDDELKVGAFYEDICNAHARKFKSTSNHHKRAIASKTTINFYNECMAELGIQK